MILEKQKLKRIRVVSSTFLSMIQSSDVIFFTCAVGFKLLNIVGSVREIPFFESKKEVDPRYMSIRALRHSWCLRPGTFGRIRTLETMMSSELRVQSLVELSLILNSSSSVPRTRNILFFETARNPHLKDSRKPRSYLLRVIRNILWIHWYRSFHDGRADSQKA